MAFFRQVSASSPAAAETRGRQPVIVALTANAATGDRCLAAGCDGYLSKAVRMDALADVLRQVPGPPAAPPRVEVADGLHV